MNQISETTKFMVANSEHIKINKNKIKDFCDVFGESHINHWLNEAPFDFIYSRDGRYFFLELNPNGQWLWLLEHSGYNLTSEIAENLIE